MAERERYIEFLYTKNYAKKDRPGKSIWEKCGLKKNRP